MYFFKKQSFPLGFLCYYRTLPLVSKISLVEFLKVNTPNTGQTPQKYHSVSNFREGLDLLS